MDGSQHEQHIPVHIYKYDAMWKDQMVRQRGRQITMQEAPSIRTYNKSCIVIIFVSPIDVMIIMPATEVAM